MKKKILWMLVSCLMMLSLVMVSCGPKGEEETKVEEEEGKVVITEEKAKEVVVEEEEEGLLPPEVPKYGGTLTLVTPTDPTSFDDCSIWWKTGQEVQPAAG
jgi:hypothetical protein